MRSGGTGAGMTGPPAGWAVADSLLADACRFPPKLLYGPATDTGPTGSPASKIGRFAGFDERNHKYSESS